MRVRYMLPAVLAALVSVHGAELRLGIIGLDTSHVVAFTQVLNDEHNPDHIAGARIVAAYKGGSPDMKLSASRVEGFTATLRDQFHVRIVDDIPTLCSRVDAVLLESVDGRVHLEQARPVFQAHKRLFIDKPVTATLADAIKIAELGKETGTPWFSASSLRFLPDFQKLRSDTQLGKLYGLEAYGRAVEEPVTPGLFFYGVHSVEALYSIMGTGCETVTMTSNRDFDVAVGQWRDGRLGTVRGIRKGDMSFGLLAFGENAVRFVPSPVISNSYVFLLKEILRFFETGVAPADNSETIETIAFMEAAERSRSLGGAPVKLGSR